MNETVMILRKCHVNSMYKGYHYIQDAVEIVAAKNEESENVRMMKDVYPVIAEKYGTSPANIEAAIRSAVEKCWKSNREYVQEILGYSTTKCPSNSEFLDALIFYQKFVE